MAYTYIRQAGKEPTFEMLQDKLLEAVESLQSFDTNYQDAIQSCVDTVKALRAGKRDLANLEKILDALDELRMDLEAVSEDKDARISELEEEL